MGIPIDVVHIINEIDDHVLIGNYVRADPGILHLIYAIDYYKQSESFEVHAYVHSAMGYAKCGANRWLANDVPDKYLHYFNNLRTYYGNHAGLPDLTDLQN